MSVKGNKLSQSLDLALYIGSTIKVAETSLGFSAAHQPTVSYTNGAEIHDELFNTPQTTTRIHADRRRNIISTAWKVKENSQR